MNTEQFSALLDGESTDWKTFLLKAFHRDQFVHSRRFKSLEEAIASGPGILDLFSGARGFSRAYLFEITAAGAYALISSIGPPKIFWILGCSQFSGSFCTSGRLEPWLHLLYALLLAQQ